MNKCQGRGALFVFFFTAMIARAETWHVAPAGNDSHPGTESQPWATLRKAAASVQPGDVVRIKAGEYYVPDG